MAKNLGIQKCKALLFFQEFTGGDFTAFLKGIGKKKAWDTWSAMPEMTPVFALLGSKADQVTISERDFEKIQRFVCVMYRRSSPHAKVDEARHAMFADGVAIENIPPTEGALM